MKLSLYPFQENILEDTKHLNKVAFYMDMGLGKSFVGSIKLKQLDESINLVVCQKSMIPMWMNHFNSYDDFKDFTTFDLTKQFAKFMTSNTKRIGIINYELAFRRSELLKLEDITLMLDESSMIQNESAKRSKFVMKLNYKNLILLSGTPINGGKYERLWSQLHMLGLSMSKNLYWLSYVRTKTILKYGFPLKFVVGYKNVPHLKSTMKEYGCRFLKTSEVFDLPVKNFHTINVAPTKEYKTFTKDRIVKINDTELIGDTILTKLLYERMLCGAYNPNKIAILKTLLESTEDRLIIFYNFDNELKAIEDLCYALDKPTSIVNGHEKDLRMYGDYNNSVTLIQYAAGSMGLNLQLANKMIYFTPPLNCEHWMQSAKRINRIGQKNPCFYYKLVVKNSVEEKIYMALDRGEDFTNRLFVEW